MKDPTILCPICSGPARRLRKHSGYRCVSEKCERYKVLVATDMQVACLKHFLTQEDEQAILAWASNQNPKPHKRFLL